MGVRLCMHLLDKLKNVTCLRHHFCVGKKMSPFLCGQKMSQFLCGQKNVTHPREQKTIFGVGWNQNFRPDLDAT